MAQWVKNLTLSLLWLGFDPGPGTSHGVDTAKKFFLKSLVSLEELDKHGERMNFALSHVTHNISFEVRS